MFFAHLVSLSDGQSYEHVNVLEEQDLPKFGIPMIFENWTGCILADKKCILVHHWKFKVIQISHERVGGSKAIHVDRIVLDGDITYSPSTIIHHDNWEKFQIPHFFVKRDGIAGQLAWSCPEGTFITHDTNVSSIMIPDPRRMGITSSVQPGVDAKTPKQTLRSSKAAENVHGRLTPHKSRFDQ